MKSRVFIFIAMFLALLLQSCQLNEVMPQYCRMQSFDETVDKMRASVYENEYSGIEDGAILSVTCDTIIGNGSVVAVEYMYGASKRTDHYYKDPNSKTVKIKSRYILKNNGYPSTSSFIYDINRYGYVEVDWMMIGFVIAFLLFLFFYWFCC